MTSGRLLIVPSTSVASGVATFVREQARALESLDVVVATPPDSDLAASLPAGTCLFPIGVSAKDMAHRLRESQARIVNTHGPRALLAAKWARYPAARIHHVFHEIPWKTGTRGLGEVALSARANRLVNSPGLLRRMTRAGIAVERVLPPIVGTPSVVARGRALELLGLTEGRQRVAVVGRLSRIKAPVRAVDALAELRRRGGPDLELVFVGEGPERTAILERAAREAIDVRLLGGVPDAASLVAAFDAILMPSEHETFGLVLAETILAEIPVAAVASPGAAWIVGDAPGIDLAQPSAVSLARVLENALACDGSPAGRLAGHVRARFGESSAAAHREYFERELAGR